MRVLEPTLIVPEQERGRPYWTPLAVPTGTVVGVMKKRKWSVVTKQKDEYYVRWHDCVGRASMGWLPKTALLTRSSTKALRYLPWNREGKLTAWDTLRERVFFNQGWSVEKYLNKFGDETMVPLLHAVIRELGGKVPRSDDPKLATRLVFTLTELESTNMARNRAEIEEQDEDETPTPRKGNKAKGKTAKKIVAKKGSSKKEKESTREGGPGRTSMYSGKRIVKLVKENPRREDTHGYNSWELLEKGMTYEEYIEAGGRRVDLAWDLMKGNVKLVK